MSHAHAYIDEIRRDIEESSRTRLGKDSVNMLNTVVRLASGPIQPIRDTRRADETGGLDLKQDMLARLQATVFSGDRARVIEFELDGGWIEQVQGRIEARREHEER